ncbi:MAG: Peptidase M16 domain protein [Candidatus Magasanikbacteria bacterium GW2011_GWA2_46_17]|uniref:Peptidase M16 domain protein n=1 Tax=Candidatus Magasanikbacteria bacterium GW2011_GWA2_46_17 TaxID=1619042 RepID=A0A0G1S199_9BACT|nr:MAG: Peptidase M16 domain protein [Candidatus Magasanikbacteria bacterium GW2011_GWA2_46_17]
MKFTKKVLKNGVRFITIPMPASPTVTFMVLVEAGSKYETKKLSGVSHFLEHFVFKGTAKRPKPADLSRELDALGAQYNAFTGQEYTGYYAKAHKDKTEKILDIVADMYLNPTLPSGELEKERGVIIQEINMYEDEPMRHVQDLFMELLYGEQPAGWNIAGTKESVSGLTQKDLAEYRKTHYVGQATTVVVSGAFNMKAMEKRISTLFGKMSDAEKAGKPPVTESQKAPAILVRYKETDQTHLVLGVRAFGTFDKRARILRVLGTILGGGMSSRLFTKLRDELGLCYYVSASPDLYTDHGVFQVAVGADTAKVSAAIKAILVELRRLVDEPVPASELRKAKDFLIGNLYLGLESSDELAQFVGMQEILRKPLKKAEQVVKEIEAVTVTDIQNLARQIFKSENLNFALIGPFKNKQDFEPILKI